MEGLGFSVVWQRTAERIYGFGYRPKRLRLIGGYLLMQ